MEQVNGRAKEISVIVNLTQGWKKQISYYHPLNHHHHVTITISSTTISITVIITTITSSTSSTITIITITIVTITICISLSYLITQKSSLTPSTCAEKLSRTWKP